MAIEFPQRVIQAPNVQYETPATGATVTVASDTHVLQLNPAGTIAALTVVFPAAPYNKQLLTISSSQIVTAVTVTSVKSVLGALTTLVVAGFASYRYNSTADFWFREG